VQFPPGNWSLHPVAAEAVVEVTKLSKPPERVTLGGQANLGEAARRAIRNPGSVTLPRDIK
jgi:hypothetical protein